MTDCPLFDMMMTLISKWRTSPSFWYDDDGQNNDRL